MDIILIALVGYTCTVVLTTYIVCQCLSSTRNQSKDKAVKRHPDSEPSESEDAQRSVFVRPWRGENLTRRVPEKVFVTRTGECFHRGSCECLRGKVGVRSFRICTVCFLPHEM